MQKKNDVLPAIFLLLMHNSCYYYIAITGRRQIESLSRKFKGLGKIDFLAPNPYIHLFCHTRAYIYYLNVLSFLSI